MILFYSSVPVSQQEQWQHTETEAATYSRVLHRTFILLFSYFDMTAWALEERLLSPE